MFSNVYSNTYRRSLVEAWDEYIASGGKYHTTVEVYDWIMDYATDIESNADNRLEHAEFTANYGNVEHFMGTVECTLTFVFYEPETTYSAGIRVRIDEESEKYKTPVYYSIASLDDLFGLLDYKAKYCKEYWVGKMEDEMWALEDYMERLYGDKTRR